VAVVAWADYMAPIVKDLPVRQFPPKPVLSGRFNPLKALRPRKPGQPAENAPTTAPGVPAEGRWRPPGRTAVQEPVIPEGTPAPDEPTAPVVAPTAPAPQPSAPAAPPPPSTPPPVLAPPPPVAAPPSP